MTLKNLLVLRHAESQEDVDFSAHSKEDKYIGITERGVRQAVSVAPLISNVLLQGRGFLVIASPCRRIEETLRNVFLGWSTAPQVSVDSRLRNLNWGSTNSENRLVIEKERYAAGVLEYSFPEGDSTPEYVKNLQFLLNNLLVDCEKTPYPESVLIATHGFALRVIVKILLGMSNEEFRWLANPSNCYLAELVFSAEAKKFSLAKSLPTVPIHLRTP